MAVVAADELRCTPPGQGSDPSPAADALECGGSRSGQPRQAGKRLTSALHLIRRMSTPEPSRARLGRAPAVSQSATQTTSTLVSGSLPRSSLRGPSSSLSTGDSVSTETSMASLLRRSGSKKTVTFAAESRSPRAHASDRSRRHGPSRQQRPAGWVPIAATRTASTSGEEWSPLVRLFDTEASDVQFSPVQCSGDADGDVIHSDDSGTLPGSAGVEGVASSPHSPPFPAPSGPGHAASSVVADFRARFEGTLRLMRAASQGRPAAPPPEPTGRQSSEAEVPQAARALQFVRSSR